MFDTQALYERNYKQTLSHLEAQRKNSSWNLEDIKKELEALYIYEGHDWDGRGELKVIEIGSSIAAYEAFLSQFE